MAEGGVEKSSMRTVLGIDDVGISTSDTFDVVVKDHGAKAGLQYDSVCITPVADTAYEDAPEKTLQVLYTPDAQMQGNLKFATVAVCEVLREVSDEATSSKVVRLRSTKPKVEASTVAKNPTAPQPESGSLGVFASDADAMTEGIFASDPEALKYVRFCPKPEATGAASSEDEAEEGVFASDPEALKYIRFGARAEASNAEGSEEGIFASDPETLKLIRFGSKPVATVGASNAEESEEGIFASDPEALKFIRFGPKPGATGASNAEESEEGIFASDPEALKFIRFGPKPGGATGASNAEESEEGIFASDPEALKFIRFDPKPEAAGASNADEPEGILASDMEVFKRIRIGPNTKAGGGGATAIKESSGSIFASDPEALKCVGLVPRPLEEVGGSQPPSKTAAEEAEGELLAEADGVQLKDDRTYSVRVSGHQLPDGQQKKFVSVRSSDGRGGLTKEELDNMQVSVETRVGEDGLVEKFVMVE